MNAQAISNAIRSAFSRFRRAVPNGRKRTSLIVASAAGTFLAALPVASLRVERAAAPFLYEAETDLSRRPWAIVPGCRAYADGTPSPMLEDRLASALALYEAGKVEKVLVSGDGEAEEHDEVAAMSRWLLERGVSEAHLFSDGAGYRTFDTMARAVRVFGIEDAVVCTQRFHLARSVYLARRLGIDAVGLVADRRSYSGAHRAAFREAYARFVALLDVNLFRAAPRPGDAFAVVKERSPAPDDLRR